MTTICLSQSVRQFSLHIALMDAQLRWQSCWRVLLQLQLLHAPKTLTTDCLIDLLNLSSDAVQRVSLDDAVRESVASPPFRRSRVMLACCSTASWRRLSLCACRSFHKEALHLMLLLVNELAGCPIFVAADVAVASRRCERGGPTMHVVCVRCCRSE